MSDDINSALGLKSDSSEPDGTPPMLQPPVLSEKLGGWLILPAIGLVGSPIILLVTIGQNISALTDETSGDIEARYSGYKAALIGEVLLNTLMLAFIIFVAVKFFKRNRQAPKLMISVYAASIALAVIDLFMVASVFGGRAEAIATTFPPLFRAFLVACVWIPYFISSKRVKRTFVLP